MFIVPVADEETLYRRVPRVADLYLVQVDGSVKISSAAFSDRSFRPSVDRAELWRYDPSKTQHEQSDGVVSVVTRNVRSIDTVVQNNTDGKPIQAFSVDVEPVPIMNHSTLPDNPAHAEIFMNPPCPNKSVFRKLAERLAQIANERAWEIKMGNLSI